MAQVRPAGASKAVVRSVQLLRALAALSVVYFHCADPGEGYSLPSTGQWGVDVFFVISGFIIARMALGDTRRFFLKRLIRIWPMYVLATLLMAVVATVFDDKIRTTSVSFGGLVKSVFFAPYDMPARHGPILELGWTLTYEMFFYLLVGLALLLFRNRIAATGAVCAVLVVLVISGEVARSSHYPVRFFQHDVLLEFVYGVVLFHVWRLVASRARVPLPIGGGLVVLGVVLLVVQDLQHDRPLDRAFHYGLPALLIMVGGLLCEHALSHAKPVELAIQLGDASYGMYLFHPFVVFALYRLLFPSVYPHDAPGADLVTAVIVIASTTVVSLLLFRYVDRPVEHALRRAVGVRSVSAVVR